MNPMDELFGLKKPIPIGIGVMNTPCKVTVLGALVTLITTSPKIISSAIKMKRSVEEIINQLGDLDEV